MLLKLFEVIQVNKTMQTLLQGLGYDLMKSKKLIG